MASLLALSRAELEQAKRRASLTDRGHACALVCGLLAVLLPPDPYLPQVAQYIPAVAPVLLAIVALICQVYALWQRVEGAKLRYVGEEARRRALLMDALGSTQEPLDVADLRQRVSKEAEETAEQFEDPKYYASRRPAGAERLFDHLQESAFYSKHLYAAASRRSGQRVAITAVGLVIGLLIALSTASNPVGVVVARVVVLAVGCVIALEWFNQYLTWGSASHEAGRVDHRIEKAAQTSLGEVALAIFSDYSAATLSAPPIPTAVYNSASTRLKDTWQGRKGAPADRGSQDEAAVK